MSGWQLFRARTYLGFFLIFGPGCGELSPSSDATLEETEVVSSEVRGLSDSTSRAVGKGQLRAHIMSPDRSQSYPTPQAAFSSRRM